MVVVAALLMLPAGWMLVAKLTRRSQRVANGDDWSYVTIRRLPIYLEESLYRNTGWAVFEPNDEPLQRARLLPLCPQCPP
jgi:hypothetical protein